jgi:2,3-bisphosphoglycerate-dependent phosphoglycerate mutase
MSHLILVRHGQSEWNLQNRFTGWVDVDLAPKGKLEACKSGELLKELKININHFFTSYQKRAINTLKLILNTMRIKDDKIIKVWELNERHYGSLTGLNKDEMKKKLGEEKVQIFRRSWDIPPEPLNKNNPYHPLNIKIYKDIPKEKIPDTESLKNTYDRVIPYFKKNIQEKIKENVIISAHGNSIRSLCKYLFKISNDDISKLEIPTGNPLVLKFDENIKLLEAKYLDEERAKNLVNFN